MTDAQAGAPTMKLKAQTIESDYDHHPSELVKGGVSCSVPEDWSLD